MRRCTKCHTADPSAFSPRARNLCRACKAKSQASVRPPRELQVDDEAMKRQKAELHRWAKAARRPIGRW